MGDLGYGDGYRYAHDEPEAFAAGEVYMPEGLENMTWYKPTPRGLEIKIGEKMKHLAELNHEAQLRGKARVRKKS
jgi:putative ATPase